MDLSTGLPFWLVKNGLPYDYPQLAKNINCDVVILGGGITAAINAITLVEVGIPCVLIEKRSLGLGSTIATTALLGVVQFGSRYCVTFVAVKCN
jgi:glycerol-3-phosphate dehydrogenase